MQACLEGLLLHTHAVQQGHGLFMQLAQVWPAQKQPVMHAKALLLQARLSGLLAEAERPQDLTEQVIELLTHAKVPPSLPVRCLPAETASHISELPMMGTEA